MSKTSYIPSSSIGSPGMFAVSWQTFVESVLSTTVKAYGVMRLSGMVLSTWEEDTFTIRLVDHMRNLAFASHLCVTYQFPVNTKRIKSGKASPKKASRIDIRVFGTWERDYDTVYFAWECKRISSAVTSEGKKLISEYITNGIMRYIKREYSSSLKDAGMLGYVLEGAVPEIVKGINASMLNPRRKQTLLPADHLQTMDAVEDFQDIYTSKHKRRAGTPINLYHLFLTFDWPKHPNQTGESKGIENQIPSAKANESF